MTKVKIDSPIINVTVPIKEKTLKNLLISAFESGSSYWMDLHEVKYADGKVRKRPKILPLQEGTVRKGGRNPPNTSTQRPPAPKGSGGAAVQSWPTWYEAPFIPGFAVIIKENYEQPFTFHELTLEKMVSGLDKMAIKYPHHFKDIIMENYDETTADIFLQLSLFGEIVYG